MLLHTITAYYWIAQYKVRHRLNDGLNRIAHAIVSSCDLYSSIKSLFEFMMLFQVRLAQEQQLICADLSWRLCDRTHS